MLLGKNVKIQAQFRLAQIKCRIAVQSMAQCNTNFDLLSVVCFHLVKSAVWVVEQISVSRQQVSQTLQRAVTFFPRVVLSFFFTHITHSFSHT